MNNRQINVLIIEDDNSEIFSIGVIDNITINDEESFMPRLMKALDEHFDTETKIVSNFTYEDLFGYEPVTVIVKIDDEGGATGKGTYKVKITETWKY